MFVQNLQMLYFPECLEHIAVLEDLPFYLCMRLNKREKKVKTERLKDLKNEQITEILDKKQQYVKIDPEGKMFAQIRAYFPDLNQQQFETIKLKLKKNIKSFKKLILEVLQYKKLFSLLEIDYDLEYYPRFNCLMPDLNAAMGISQDKSLNHRLELRKQIGNIYEEAVKKSRGTYLIKEEDTKRIYPDFPIIIKSSLKDTIKYFRKKDIEVIRPFAYPLHHYLNLDKNLLVVFFLNLLPDY